MIELSILKLFTKDREIYDRYNPIIEDLNLEEELTILSGLVDRYYDKFPQHAYISQDELVAFFSAEYPTRKDSDKFQNLISRIYQLDISREMATDLVRAAVEKDMANQMANELLPVALGECRAHNFERLRDLLERFDLAEEVDEEEDPFYDPELDELLEETTSDGLTWRLEALRKGLGPLVGGTLGHVFARPEAGKTTFCHSEVSYMTPQMHRDECILWFNNEEDKKRVKLRYYSAVTGMVELEVRANPAKAKHLWQERGGNRMKLCDIDTITVAEIERMCRKYKPRLVIIDQGDKVHYRGEASAGNGADRLRGVYDLLRSVVKRCNNEWKMDMLTVGQADAPSEGKRKLQLGNLDSGKTGKAGAFDYVIGIGFDPDQESVRYITFAKNKLKGDHSTYMVNFNKEQGRYSD